MVANPLSVMRISNHNQGELSNIFGMTRNGGTRPHQGWDLAAPVGATVYAVRNGAVVDICETPAYGLQLLLQISATDGPKTSSAESDVFAFYAHLSETLVDVGAQVVVGAPIARSGNSGNVGALPPHLHFEIRTRASVPPFSGLTYRVDPGQVLGYEHLACRDSHACPIYE
tara:strand:- start:116 stop:628 length:513 start_codon:yes stop_codon:yes gene_type:complete